MKPQVYIETSVVSYLTAKPSRDLIVAAHQQITHEWWEILRPKFDLFISELVIREAAAGDRIAAKKRLDILDEIPILGLNEKVLSLAGQFTQSGLIPEKAKEDALHIALATVHGIDYLLTWNCRHIANAKMFKRMISVCLSQGYETPVICTPEELIGD